MEGEPCIHVLLACVLKSVLELSAVYIQYVLHEPHYIFPFIH